MRWFQNRRSGKDAMDLAEAGALLDRWEFAAGPERIDVRPRSAAVTAADLAWLTKRLVAAESSLPAKEIVFDFSAVEQIGPRWTVVLAMLVHLAQRLSARCRIVELRGQPAAAVGLYRRSSALMALVRPSRSAA